ncbi:MAG TPA: type I-E CRISPR-associated protein Cse2/CasB [Candidatus Hydrogenedentes bacterium]|nr:type I-E CRISPR-associated protein Cse2/CasB [Candidatus Hydrogenedentota bacterium]HPG65202.1 type I-E CRISPR-associated protein Cse2/CasB [Candidatus Hydrogenedentota bacterium]
MTATEQFIDVLGSLKTGELGLLRAHAGQELDESVVAFDLFAGLWWPLRQRNQRAPRREVAWLIAKLFALHPLPHSPGDTLARQLRHCQPKEEAGRRRYQDRFDEMLALPVARIESALQWALGQVSSKSPSLDWVRLTDELSIWHREDTRLKWAEQFLGNVEGR